MDDPGSITASNAADERAAALERAFDAAEFGYLDVPDDVLDAMVHCASLWGLQRTRIDDVARFAGMSRASIYRHVPGGKDELIRYAGVREALRILGTVVDALADGDDLEEQLRAGLAVAATEVRAHPALSYLVEHEPESLLPYFAFDRLDPTLRRISEVCAPALSRFVDRDTALELGEWCARIVIHSFLDPDDLTLADDASIDRLVTRFVAPGARRAAAMSTQSTHQTSMPRGGAQ